MEFLIFQEKEYCICVLIKDDQYHGQMKLKHCRNKNEVLELLSGILSDKIKFYPTFGTPKFTINIKREKEECG